LVDFASLYKIYFVALAAAEVAMAVRSVRAFLHNETNFPLIKISDECPDGEWTTRAPDRIEANSTAVMRAASKLLGGVESRATYQIGLLRFLGGAAFGKRSGRAFRDPPGGKG
jgi:hypothetical protein